MRILSISLLMLITALGCSSSAMNPVNPSGDLNESLQIAVSDWDSNGNPSGGFGVMGLYSIRIDVENVSAEIVPVRSLNTTDTLETVDITNFLSVAPCTNCVRIRSISMDADQNAVLSIGIKHPFGAGDPDKPITGRNRADLHVFNIEGIVAVQGSTSTLFPSTGVVIGPVELVNASGYTPYLDNVLDLDFFETDANLHPYILHFADYSPGNFDPNDPKGFVSVTNPPPSGNLVMAMGADFDYRDYVFQLTEDIDFTFAIGCTYAITTTNKSKRFEPEYRIPQHMKKAASEVHVIPPSENLKQMEPDFEITVQVQVVDPSHGVSVGDKLDQMLADSSVSSVTLEIPGVLSGRISQTGNDAISGSGHDPSDPLAFDFTFSNELVAVEGVYPGIVKVTDSYPTGLNESMLLNGKDGIKRVGPTENPASGVFEISEFATYAYFTIEVEYGFVGHDPIAAITRSATACAPIEVFFDASGSFDEDDFASETPLNFEFDFDYDGINFTIDRPMSTNPLASYVYTVEGCYTAAVRVTDSHNNTDIATVVVPIAGFTPAGVESDITDGVTITNIDFRHSAPTFVSPIYSSGLSDPVKGSARGSGYIYTVFYGEEGGSKKIFFSRSDNDGLTWSTPVALHTYDSSGLYSGCSIVADNTGQVLVVWADHYHRELGLEYSFDSGATFSSNMVRNESDCMYWCYKFRLPDVAIDPTNPDNIVISVNYNYYGDPTGWFWGWDHMYIYNSTTGPDGIFNEVLFVESDQWYPPYSVNIYKIHAHFGADGKAYVIAGENSFIFVFKSIDHGMTWSVTDPSLYKVNIVAPYHRDFDSAMDLNTPDVFYIAAVRRQSPYNVELYKSTDGLNISMIQTRVNDVASSYYKLCPSVTVNDIGAVYVMWHTNETGNYQIMADYSCNGGTTFSTDVVFNTIDAGNDIDPDLIQTICGEGVVCIWEQYGDLPNGKLVSRRG